MAADEILNTLQELVVSICDKLYAERELITKPAVSKLVRLHGNWEAEVLDQQLPGYINQWRLNNLQDCDQPQQQESINHLEAQLNKYKAELANARQTIKQLQMDLLSKSNDIKILRFNVMKELRGLLDG